MPVLSVLRDLYFREMKEYRMAGASRYEQEARSGNPYERTDMHKMAEDFE